MKRAIGIFSVAMLVTAFVSFMPVAVVRAATWKERLTDVGRQEVLTVYCGGGSARTEALAEKLRAGWIVIDSVPVQSSTATGCIVYILQR